jgi:hypothetical protein
VQNHTRVTATASSARVSVSKVPGCAGRNCGSNARKNTAALGLRALQSSPSRNAPPVDPGTASGPVTGGRIAASRARIPRYARYAAPAYRIVVSTTGTVATSAATPAAAATAQRKTPVATPVAAAMPSVRPRSAERRTTTARSGPGDIAPRLTTPQNAIS